MRGWSFSKYIGEPPDGSPFEQLLRLFQEILLHTNGDIDEALSWLTEIDKQHGITNDKYGISDFIKDLETQGWVDRNKTLQSISSKMEKAIRQNALDDIFDHLRKSSEGQHNTRHEGKGDELTADNRNFKYGDSLDQLDISESIKNAQINHGIDDFRLREEDLVIKEAHYQTQTSTVLMIDISHSMILYGEDRITPAKKVALALAELIMTRYPKDTIDVIVFGNDAWEVKIKDLPYLEVGPYHTNTVAGLELAINILRKRKNPNKQIFMITDGKPTCIKKGKKYYQNSYGLDRQIINRTLALAVKCRKQNIPITTFMIARDPYLVSFVDSFTKANNGKAFYSTLGGLGEFIFMDYKNSKRNRNR
jgi:uncharacterized protein with von Willebrand factor type A (vWA) domain